MKQLIITALFLCSIGTAIAQTTTPATPPPAKPAEAKPEFKPDFNKPATIEVKLSLPGGVINDYIVYKQNGHDAIFNSTQITAAQASQFERNYNLVADSINAHIAKNFQSYIDAQKVKFTADTTAKYHPKPQK